MANLICCHEGTINQYKISIGKKYKAIDILLPFVIILNEKHTK